MRDTERHTQRVRDTERVSEREGERDGGGGQGWSPLSPALSRFFSLS